MFTWLDVQMVQKSLHESSSLPLEGNKYTSSFWRFYANSRKELAYFLFPFPLLVDLRVICNTKIDDFLKLFCETFTDYFSYRRNIGNDNSPIHSQPPWKLPHKMALWGGGNNSDFRTLGLNFWLWRLQTLWPEQVLSGPVPSLVKSSKPDSMLQGWSRVAALVSVTLRGLLWVGSCPHPGGGWNAASGLR